MKSWIVIFVLLIPTIAGAIQPEEFVSRAADMMARTERGISIDRYSDLLFDLSKTAQSVLDDQTNKDNIDYEFLKKHIEIIVQHADGIARLKRHAELERFKYIPVDYRYSAYGISCEYQIQVVAGVEVCEISALISLGIERIRKELDVIVKGLRDGF